MRTPRRHVPGPACREATKAGASVSLDWTSSAQQRCVWERIDKAMAKAALLTARFYMLPARVYCNSGGVEPHMVL